MTVYVIGHQNCPTTAQLLPWSQSCHVVQFLRKSRSTLIFLLAGDSLKKLFDSFAQFFTKQHKKILIILKIDYFYLAGFLHQIMFPKCTLSVTAHDRHDLDQVGPPMHGHVLATFRSTSKLNM